MQQAGARPGRRMPGGVEQLRRVGEWSHTVTSCKSLRRAHAAGCAVQLMQEGGARMGSRRALHRSLRLRV